MGWLPLLFASLVLIPATPAPSQPAPPVRTEVPIHELRLSDGVLRYGVPVTIGGTSVLAGLDTGASGLRLMPDAVPAGEVRTGMAAEAYNFGTGSQLEGVVGQARITIGALSGPASVHLVRKVGCNASRPRCPGSLGLGYGFLGDGLPREGYRVLLGANMGPTTIDNPLQAAGARRWIIELPRPGDALPGRLILNPTAEEVAEFTTVRLVGGFAERDGGGLHDSVAGCLRNEKSGARACGPIAMDTGAFMVRALNARLGAEAWPAGTPMALEFHDDQRKPAFSVRMVAGGRAQVLYFADAPRRETIVQPGTAPYFAYAVLYDPASRRLGFKARPAVEGLPRAEMVGR